MDFETFSVGQIQRKARNAIAREFRGPVWVTGELKTLREQRSNLYLTLIEPGDYADGSDAAVDVTCWSKRHLVLRSQLNDAGISLVAGMEVRILGDLSLNKFGKLSLNLQALDIDSLAGKQAVEKRRIYAVLEREGLLQRNKALSTPLVPLRIGLVTSENSEGCNDFLGQLQRSPFAFQVTLVHSAVQGPAAPNALARAIGNASAGNVDLVAIVRGGGGELDAFDKEQVARAIAESRIPVWTGIGHTGDHSIADDVAQRALITPTECGQAIVITVDEFAARASWVALRLHTLANRSFDDARNRLVALSQQIDVNTRQRLTNDARTVDALRVRLSRSATTGIALRSAGLHKLKSDLVTTQARFLGGQTKHLEYMRKQLDALDPRRPLKLGFSLTHNAEGGLIRDATELDVDDVVVTTFSCGKVRATVTERETT